MGLMKFYLFFIYIDQVFTTQSLNQFKKRFKELPKIFL